MRVIRARAMGMCFGVRDALAIAERVDDPNEVTMHGELVHNERVLVRLNNLGFQQITETERHQLPMTDRVLVTAHGVSERERNRLASAGKTLIDTTCPLVRRVHEAAAELEAEGRRVLIVGRPGHVEVRGITEDLRTGDVLARPDDVRHYSEQLLGIVSQTTTPPDRFDEIVRRVRQLNPDTDLRVRDTICAPTRDRQRAIGELCEHADVVVVVGGSNSNNTAALAALARSHGRAAHRVAAEDELRAEWFTPGQVVGLTAGTSTLPETIDAVERWLTEFTPSSVPTV